VDKELFVGGFSSSFFKFFECIISLSQLAKVSIEKSTKTLT
jgi:hypothetical protein